MAALMRNVRLPFCFSRFLLKFESSLKCVSSFHQLTIASATPYRLAEKKYKESINSQNFSLTRSYSSQPASKEQLDQLVKRQKVVVFMKGIPSEPRCGFSNTVVQILRMHGVEFDSYDVLEDESIRQGIKAYSNWPTIPQVFINGEFVGGCDVMLQLHQNGELIEEFQKAGIRSALLDTVDQKSEK